MIPVTASIWTKGKTNLHVQGENTLSHNPSSLFCSAVTQKHPGVVLHVHSAPFPVCHTWNVAVGGRRWELVQLLLFCGKWWAHSSPVSPPPSSNQSKHTTPRRNRAQRGPALRPRAASASDWAAIWHLCAVYTIKKSPKMTVNTIFLLYAIARACDWE